jgi:hypothetical protein
MVATRIHQSWRNRPEGDAAWSDRESTDAAFRDGSDQFQGRGIAAAAIAESTLKAVLTDQFYVFTGPNWPSFMERTLGRAMRAENPYVLTWGEDRRPETAREPAPWANTSKPV